MPNGLDVPGVPAEGTSFTALAATVGGFFGSFFGGGDGGPRIIATGSAGSECGPGLTWDQSQQRCVPICNPGDVFDVSQGICVPSGVEVSPITGREPIPTPEEGGPPLVTERITTIFFNRSAPMAVDSPLLSGFGSFLPAVRQAASPTIGAFLGGLAQDLIPALLPFRPAQETGLGQLPVPVARAALPAGEKPSSRILRQIQANTGVRIKLSSAKALARQLGLQNAARCLGITTAQLCTLIITPSPRRRRGISSSDIRIVKRTARRFESLKHDLSHIGGRATPHFHRRKTRHAHTHAHK